MNVDIENQENFEKKKKIIVISLSALIFITLIAGFFFIKKNNKKGNSYENNNHEEVVNKNNDNDKVNKNDICKENRRRVMPRVMPEHEKIREDDYYFNKNRAIINIISFIIIEIFFFYVENHDTKNKIINEKNNVNHDNHDNHDNHENNSDNSFKKIFYGDVISLFGSKNAYGVLSVGRFVIVAIPIEFFINFFIGSLSYFFDNVMSKGYFGTLSIFMLKKKNFSFLMNFCYFLFSLLIAVGIRAKLLFCDNEKQENNKENNNIN